MEGQCGGEKCEADSVGIEVVVGAEPAVASADYPDGQYGLRCGPVFGRARPFRRNKYNAAIHDRLSNSRLW